MNNPYINKEDLLEAISNVQGMFIQDNVYADDTVPPSSVI
jgi:hypothetical protein